VKFVDRHEELDRLGRVMRTREAALVILWGRRRVGKTRLLLDWVRREGGVFWVSDESTAPIQRRYFAGAIEARLPGFGQVEYPDWSSLLSRLCREARQAKWRGPIVIDELPYLLGPSPELPSILQRFIDHDAKDAGLVIALSGSSQRMMQGLTLGKNAPLYGRAREVMKLQPIPAGYLGQALGLRDPRRVVESYACWGGIPRYWELALPFGDLRTAVDALVLNPLGALHDEPSRLLLEESPPAVALRPLLDVIGAGAHRGSEIAGRVGQPATSLSRPLSRLQELDMVAREVPFGEPERSGKRALYKLADPFLRLWFSIVGPRRSLLMQASPRARLQLFDDRLPHLCAMAWEELCRLAVPRLADRLGGIDFGPARRFWHGHGPEWDVVAESSDRNALLLGESKWLAHDPSVSEVEQMVRQLIGKGIPAISHGAVVHHAMFLPSLPRGMRRSAAGATVHLVDAATVLAALR
jgi:AAA+ ATPase superfamily predicted ATPase